MAQLNDLLVLGNSNLLGTVSAPAGLSTNLLLIPTASNSTTYGVGSNGQVLKSNGSSVYWGTDNNNTYSLADASTPGLVKIGYTQSGKNYPVQLSNGQMYVNVPWTDNNTTYGVVSTTANGLAPKRDGSTTKFLRGDGTWAVPPNTNTHYTTGITAGASGTTSNSAASNPYVKIKDDSTHRSQIQIKGGGATTVSSNANGVITISSTDNNTTYSAATSSTAGLMSAADKTKLDGIAAQANKYSLPTASSSTLGGVKIGSNINISNGVISVPAANKDTAGVTVVYPAASCTSFSSDSGAITPLAAQKSAELFAITRPPKRSSSNPANPGAAGTCTINNIVRWLNTAGDVQDSKITIEDVKNTRDTTKTAQVISIPAEGGKKMVYGYCTDQVDGTSFIGGVFDASATSYPYASGLAIGGTSGNLLWKGKQVATTDMIPASLKNPNALTIQGGGITSFTYDGSTAKTLNIKASSNVSISSKTNGEITISAEDTTYSASNGIIVENNIIKHANSSITAGTASTAAATLTNGGSFNIPSITYDAYGHITGTGSTKITLPTITAPEEVVISSTQPSSDLWIDTTDSTKAKIKYKNGSSYKEIQAASGVYVGSGTMPTGYNVQIDPTSTADSTVLVTKAEFDALVARVAALETA